MIGKARPNSGVQASLSTFTLAFRRFRRHRLGVLGGIAIAIFYAIALFAEIIAPTTPSAYRADHRLVPPMPIQVFARDDGGQWRFELHSFRMERTIDAETLRRHYVVDPNKRVPLGLFVRGEVYRLWGVIKWDRHLIGPLDPSAAFYPLGADRLGRDLASRLIYGARVSLSVGLVGVGLSFLFGIMFGGLSGLLGGWVDDAVQRFIEILDSIPTIPLWIALAAAIPSDLPPLQVYFLITVILSLIGWTSLARVVRGRFLSLRTEEFVVAARLDGASSLRIVTHHLLPNFASHIIAALTLAIPGMILAETALSFLGIGLAPPVVSWGVLLQDAQNVRTLVEAPWLLLPGAAVVFAVLSLNFLGDGLRDASDPFR